MWQLPRIMAFFSLAVFSQTPIMFSYVYDDTGQLVKVVDSTGIVIEYVYDAVGNMLEIKRTTITPGALSIFGFTPARGQTLSQVTIHGQGFSTTPSANTVKFNGVLATVVSSTTQSLVVIVPSGAISGPVSVTVGAASVVASVGYTIAPVPVITSVIPRGAISNTSLLVAITGINLSASAFAFLPVFAPAAFTLGPATINSTGTSATMNLTVGTSAIGKFTMVGTNAAGSSSPFATDANSFAVVSASAASKDSDGDGLSDAQEVSLGTDPFSADTDGDGYGDGAEVASGADPLNPTCIPLNCRIPGGEANVTFSILNSLATTGGPSEAVSVTFSMCNDASASCPGFTRSSVPPQTSSVRSRPESITPKDKDVSPPAPLPTLTVAAVIPSAGAGAVDPRSPVTIIFPEAMDPDSLAGDGWQLYSSGHSIPTSVSVASDFRSITLQPVVLPADSEITVAVTKPINNLFGQTMQEFRSSFKTGAAGRPSQSELHPPTGSGGVPADISLFVSQGVRINVAQDGNPVAGSLWPDNNLLRFKPDVPFNPGAVVAISGGGTVRYEGAFVVDGIADDEFKPIRVWPGSKGFFGPYSSVEIEFNKALDPTTINNDTVSLRTAEGRPLSVNVWLRGARTIQFAPNEALLPGSEYSYELSDGVRDIAGRSFAIAFRRVFTAYPAASTPFALLSIIPVPLTASVRIAFSSAVNPLSVTGDTVRLTSAMIGPVPVAVSFAKQYQEVILTPLIPLADGSSLEIAISGARDGAGNTTAPAVTRITTGSRPRAGAAMRDANNPKRLTTATLKRR
jgi:YD repeat-containing protein